MSDYDRAMERAFTITGGADISVVKREAEKIITPTDKMAMVTYYQKKRSRKPKLGQSGVGAGLGAGVSELVGTALAVRRGLEFLDELEPISELLGIGDPDMPSLNPLAGVGKADPKDFPVGFSRGGWVIKKITDYQFGRPVQKNVWSKPYKKMSFNEKCAYFQGVRVQKVTGRKARNRAYRNGFNDGAKEQSEREMMMEGGTTPPVRYRRR